MDAGAGSSVPGGQGLNEPLPSPGVMWGCPPLCPQQLTEPSGPRGELDQPQSDRLNHASEHFEDTQTGCDSFFSNAF